LRLEPLRGAVRRHRDVHIGRRLPHPGLADVAAEHLDDELTAAAHQVGQLALAQLDRRARRVEGTQVDDAVDH